MQPEKELETIRVAVRVRPPLKQELSDKSTFDKLQIDNEQKIINAHNERTKSYKNCAFDMVFDKQSSQGQIFQECGISSLVKKVVEGYNSTIFAYGQTGSGKTFTMEGYQYKPDNKGVPQAVIESGDNEGIVPRSVRLLFDQIKQESNLGRKKYTVSCSYLQVYKEKIYDLLNKSHLKRLVTDGPGLKLKLVKDIFMVENLYTFECRSADDILALYHFGIKNKIVASHNMNNASSRSHSMLKLTVETIDAKNPEDVVVSTLQLVDLAGSERQGLTGQAATKESIEINKSLLTLRQVITALTEQQESYIPYRDSKLTCLLRQSLGGNSYCLMLACLNPCDQHIEENLSTLAYASRASYITNKPLKNNDPRNRQIDDLKNQVKLLTEELAKANETIEFLTKVTGQNPDLIKNNLSKYDQVQANGSTDNFSPLKSIKRQDSDVTQKQQKTSSPDVHKNTFSPDHDSTSDIKSMRTTGLKQGNVNQNSAANESKDAITSRIIHTVNMMKEVLQGNLNLRETIAKQSELIDEQNGEIFQLQNENEDLRERLQVLEEINGKESGTPGDLQQLVKDKRVLEKRCEQLEKTSNNWINMNRMRGGPQEPNSNGQTSQGTSHMAKRATMTNFAKRTIIENNINKLESRGGPKQGGTRQTDQANNYASIPTVVSGTTADDFEPVRPNMTAGHVVANSTSQHTPQHYQGQQVPMNTTGVPMNQQFSYVSEDEESIEVKSNVARSHHPIIHGTGGINSKNSTQKQSPVKMVNLRGGNKEISSGSGQFAYTNGSIYDNPSQSESNNKVRIKGQNGGPAPPSMLPSQAFGSGSKFPNNQQMTASMRRTANRFNGTGGNSLAYPVTQQQSQTNAGSNGNGTAIVLNNPTLVKKAKSNTAPNNRQSQGWQHPASRQGEPSPQHQAHSQYDYIPLRDMVAPTQGSQFSNPSNTMIKQSVSKSRTGKFQPTPNENFSATKSPDFMRSGHLSQHQQPYQQLNSTGGQLHLSSLDVEQASGQKPERSTMQERRRPGGIRSNAAVKNTMDEPAPPRFDQPVSTFVGPKGMGGPANHNNNNRNELPEI